MIGSGILYGLVADLIPGTNPSLQNFQCTVLKMPLSNGGTRWKEEYEFSTYIILSA